MNHEFFINEYLWSISGNSFQTKIYGQFLPISFQIKNRHNKLNSDLTIMKFLKDLKTWKTIIQFIITVLTAIISSFFVQSCKTW